VDVETEIDWKSPNTLLKAAFPLAASNPKATYDLGLGTIQRPNNQPTAYEVPAQQWADVTDVSGALGVAVLNDSKYGWDKPADNILRLTLLHTPLPRAYPYQSSNDLGHHHFVYSIAGHRGDWRGLIDGDIPRLIERGSPVPARAAALNQPLIAFQTEPHAGPLGRMFVTAGFSDNDGQVAIRALKKAEDSDEFVLRLWWDGAGTGNYRIGAAFGNSETGTRTFMGVPLIRRTSCANSIVVTDVSALTSTLGNVATLEIDTPTSLEPYPSTTLQPKRRANASR
jgi:alpha-mannosidase